jgi:hypothetical protein
MCSCAAHFSKNAGRVHDNSPQAGLISLFCALTLLLWRAPQAGLILLLCVLTLLLHACFCSEAHGYEPLPGCEPGQAFIRRLAPELFSAKQLPPGLQQRLAQTGLDWDNHPGNTRRVSVCVCVSGIGCRCLSRCFVCNNCGCLVCRGHVFAVKQCLLILVFGLEIITLGDMLPVVHVRSRMLLTCASACCSYVC